MSKTTLSTCLILGPLLGSSLAAAQSPAARDEPRETTAKAPETAPAAEPEPVPYATSTAPAPLPAAPAPVRGSVQPPSSPVHTHWYGWQTLATDGAALALALMTIGATNGGDSGGAGVALFAVATIGTYAVGAPIVHFSHDNPWRGLGSLASRGVLPLLGGEMGARFSGCGYRGNSCATLGVFLGIAGAIAMDAAVFSYEQVPVRTDAAPTFGVAADGQRTLLTAQGKF